MKNILISLMTVGLVSGAVWGSTSAFFSDTETSQANILEAGDVDLEVANSSYYWDYSANDGAGGVVMSTETSWTFDDEIGKFFNFTDVKPGDWGEDTISMMVSSNEAYMCAQVLPLTSNENTAIDPELDVGDEANNLEGELEDYMEFFFWLDDGDNVYEDNGIDTYITSGPASNIMNGVTLALQDSDDKLLEPDETGAQPNVQYHIGKIWCLGELTVTPVAEDSTDPTVRNDGVNCNGATVSNVVQTDQLLGNLNFYAEQTRNNPDFKCSSLALNETP